MPMSGCVGGKFSIGMVERTGGGELEVEALASMASGEWRRVREKGKDQPLVVKGYYSAVHGRDRHTGVVLERPETVRDRRNG